MKIHIRDLTIFLFTVLTIAALIILSVRPAAPVNSENIVYRAKLDSIAVENKKLAAKIESQKHELTKFNDKIDSLSTLLPKIKEQYKKRAHEIDNKNVTELISGFDQLFSDNGIK